MRCGVLEGAGVDSGWVLGIAVWQDECGVCCLLLWGLGNVFYAVMERLMC